MNWSGCPAPVIMKLMIEILDELSMPYNKNKKKLTVMHFSRPSSLSPSFFHFSSLGLSRKIEKRAERGRIKLYMRIMNPMGAI